MKIVSKADFLGFVSDLISDQTLDVVGVKSKGDKFVFGPLDKAEDLRLDYDITILPPKKYFLPQYETLFEYDLTNPIKQNFHKEGKKRVILGVHPYDIMAIKHLDTYFLAQPTDDAYMKRRLNTLIIGVNVQKVAPKAFFGNMNTGSVETGYDLMLTDLGDKIAIEVGTKDGMGLIWRFKDIRDPTPEEAKAQRDAVKKACAKGKRKLKAKPEEWHDLLVKNYESKIWKSQGEKCLGCASCTLVCPTCFCYDVNDEVNTDMRTGKRTRTWDGCLLRNFTLIGSSEVFRKDVAERYRHRFERKGKYIPDRFGFIACVGCGRCATQCIPDIADPVQLMNMLEENNEEPTVVKDLHAVVNDVNLSVDDGVKKIFETMPATIEKIQKLTVNETLFVISFDNGKPFMYQPGQFVEVSILGVGEAPFGLSTAPGGKTIELVVRKVGDVTSALHKMKVGDKVGIRGPLGTGFDTEMMKGKNLLFIAGGLGIVPLRSMINYVLEHRKDYNEVTILYGGKEPTGMLFAEDVAKWDKRSDIQRKFAVEKCPDGVCWTGEVGMITSLIPKVVFDPKKTIALVCGPPIMYKFVIRDLLGRGMPPQNIVVDLERRMKCGVGKCGHCQINGVYVCKEGPVFYYETIRSLPEALE